MNKNIFNENILAIKEAVGEDFPKVANLCEQTVKISERSFINALSYFRKNFAQFTNIENVKGVYEKVEQYIDENYLRLNVELTKQKLANSNNSIAPNIIPKVNSILEASDEELMNKIKATLSDFKFIPSVGDLFSIVEEIEMNTYEESKKVEEAETKIEKLILKALQSINESSSPTESRILRKVLKVSKSRHELSAADAITNINEDDSFSENTQELIDTAKSIVENNQYRLKVVKLVEHLENHRNRTLFTKPLSVLKNLIEKEESVLENTLTSELQSYHWVPGVNSILEEESSKRQKAINEAKEKMVFEATHPIAPVVNEGSIFYVKLGDTVYEYSNGEYSVSTNEEAKSKLLSIDETVKPFSWNNDTNSFVYRGDNKELTIQVTEDSAQIKVGNTVMENNQLDNAISIIGNNVPKAVVEGAKYLAKNGSSKFVIIDEAIQLGTNENATYIVMDESNVFKNGKAVENIENLIQEMKYEYGVNISKFLLEFLNTENQAGFFINEQKTQAETVVEFFRAQINKIDEKIDDIDEHPELYALRESLVKQLKDAENKKTEIVSVYETFMEEGIQPFLITEDDDEEEEEAEDVLDQKESVLNYFFQQSDGIEEDELPEEHLDMAQKEVEEKFSKGKKISKSEIDEIISNHVQEAANKTNEDLDSDMVEAYLDNIEDDMMGHDHAVKKTAKQFDTDETDVEDTLKRNKIDFNEAAEEESDEEEEEKSDKKDKDSEDDSEDKK